MDEYINKISDLPDERLLLLIKLYQKTISQIEERHREAMMVGMDKIAVYDRAELEKKKAELEQVQQILERRATNRHQKSGQ